MIISQDINLSYVHHISDQAYDEAVQYLLHGIVPTRSSPAIARFKRRWRNAAIRVDQQGKPRIFFGEREVIPEAEIETVLSRLHYDPLTGGNLGRDKFYYRVRNLTVGVSRADVDKFVQNDETHQLLRRIAPRMKVVRPLPVPEGSKIWWQMDLIDMGDDKTHDNLGYRYILTVVDIWSKYAWAKALKSKEATEVVQALEDILQQTTPHIIQSDNGGEFKNQQMVGLAYEYGFKQIFGSPYRPQSQGACEKFNQTLKRMMYAHMMRYSTKVWVDVLPAILTNYNSVVHSTTGFPPTFLHMTVDKRIIEQVSKKVLKRNHKWMKQNFKHYKPIKVGDPVRVSLLVFADFRRESTFVL